MAGNTLHPPPVPGNIFNPPPPPPVLGNIFEFVPPPPPRNTFHPSPVPGNIFHHLPVPGNISRTGLDKAEFTWTVPNFLELRKDVDKINKQHIYFDLGRRVGIAGRWRCYMQYKKLDNKNWIGIYVHAVTYPSNVDKIPVTCEFKLPTKTANASVRKLDQEFTNNTDWGFHKFMSQDGPLQNFQLQNVALKENGDLEINIVVTISKSDISPIAGLLGLASHLNTFKDKLCSDLDKMYSNCLETSNHPTKIRSRDGKEFPICPAVLAARSPVFKKLFLQNNQTKNDILEVTDISSEPLNVLLNFMHTGKLLESWKNLNIIEELVYGAWKYEQNDLLEYLDQALVYVCTNTNCGRLMSLARQLKLKTAEGRLMEYFKLNLTDIGQVIKFAMDAQSNWIKYYENLSQWRYVRAMQFAQRLYNVYRSNKRKFDETT